ncbi:MAG: NAD(P)/FAD-dependent oxidoreductase, partial [Bacteroidetes bacterium]
MKKNSFDLIVIGAGPGGIEAALFASRKNLSVGLISATKIGGRATWGSLVPSKVWLASAEKAKSISGLEAFGFKSVESKLQLDLDELRKKVGEQSSITSERYVQKLHKAGVNLFFGKASIKDPQSINIELNDGGHTEIKARNIIVATGSGPRFTPDIKPNKDHIIAPKIAPGVEKIPDSLVMAGGGVTGTEYAYAFAALGTKVTIIQNGNQLLPRLDEEVSRLFEDYLTSNFPVKIVTGAKVTNMVQEG